MANIGIVGSSGFVAKALLEALKNKNKIILFSHNTSVNARMLDLTRFETFDKSFFDDISVLFFPAAISSLDFCENRYEEAYKINVVGTAKYIKEALERNIKVVFFSSDAVYGEKNGKMVTERDKVSPISKYGEMKAEIEQLFKNNKNFKTVRLSYVFSCKDKFTKYYLNCVDKKEQAEIYHPFYRNVVTISEVVEIVKWLLTNWNKYTPFDINACGRELISRVRIVDAINLNMRNYPRYAIVDMPKDMMRIRPNIMRMNSIYLSNFGIKSLDESFEDRVLRELNKNSGGNKK